MVLSISDLRVHVAHVVWCKKGWQTVDYEYFEIVPRDALDVCTLQFSSSGKLAD